MEQIGTSPLHLQVRRPELYCAQASAPKDLRWHLLDLVRTCRDSLHLRDRDITVLRGLMSLVPAPASRGRLTVFASNRVLIDRCDGIDERTLRRRLAHLQSVGLVLRRSSPNGKRFQVRAANAEPCLSYGIDLSPLFDNLDQLEAMAELCHKEALRKTALRAMIRDTLYQHGQDLDLALSEKARLSLRRALSGDQLQELLDELASVVKPARAVTSSELTASYGQNDRHIQSSDKEDYESEAEDGCQTEAQLENESPAMKCDISLDECLELAKTGAEMAPVTPQTWEDVIVLSNRLAPAIGLSPASVEGAKSQLGAHGVALAVLGLVEAYGRIRNPQAYLASLTAKAGMSGIDLVRMFRSLTQPKARFASAG